MPTTEPQKSEWHGAAARQLSKQFCCRNVETCTLMYDQLLPRRDIDEEVKQKFS